MYIILLHLKNIFEPSTFFILSKHINIRILILTIIIRISKTTELV